MNTIQIIQAPDLTHPYAVINKPAGLPSAPLSESDNNNAFSHAAELFPVLLEVKGRKEIEHGLLHRLDTETSGLLLIAATQTFYDYIIQQQNNGKFIKQYKAECLILPKNALYLEGFPKFPNQYAGKKKFTLVSMFRAFGKGAKAVRPVSENSSTSALKKSVKKIYSTDIELTECASGTVTALCTIREGFRHQVRCHLAWAGFPIIGDSLYNSAFSESDGRLHFTAFTISFPNPSSEGIIEYKI